MSENVFPQLKERLTFFHTAKQVNVKAYPLTLCETGYGAGLVLQNVLS